MPRTIAMKMEYFSSTKRATHRSLVPDIPVVQCIKEHDHFVVNDRCLR